MKMYELCLRFHWNCIPKDRINNILALFQIMAWRQPGGKPLSELMMVSLLTHIYGVTRHQWANNYHGLTSHDDVIKWKHFPRYWPFVRGIHRSPVNSSHKGQWREALMFSLICTWISGWVNTREAVDLRRNSAHDDVTVMCSMFTGVPCFLDSMELEWHQGRNRCYSWLQCFHGLSWCLLALCVLYCHGQWTYGDELGALQLRR